MSSGLIEFLQSTAIGYIIANPAALLQMIQQQPLDYKLQGPHKLRLLFDEESAEERLRISNEIMERLSP